MEQMTFIHREDIPGSLSQLFRTRFPADFSPGQKDQPMFWFKDNYM